MYIVSTTRYMNIETVVMGGFHGSEGNNKLQANKYGNRRNKTDRLWLLLHIYSYHKISGKVNIFSLCICLCLSSHNIFFRILGQDISDIESEFCVLEKSETFKKRLWEEVVEPSFLNMFQKLA